MWYQWIASICQCIVIVFLPLHVHSTFAPTKWLLIKRKAMTIFPIAQALILIMLHLIFVTPAFLFCAESYLVNDVGLDHILAYFLLYLKFCCFKFLYFNYKY